MPTFELKLSRMDNSLEKSSQNCWCEIYSLTEPLRFLQQGMYLTVTIYSNGLYYQSNKSCYVTGIRVFA